MMALGSFRIFFCYHCRKHFWCPAWLVLVCTLNSIKHLASNCFSRLCREGSLTWSIICFNMNWKHGTNVCHQWDSQIWRIWYFWLHEKKKRHFFPRHLLFHGKASQPRHKTESWWELWVPSSWSAAGSVTRSLARHKTGIVQVASDS